MARAEPRLDDARTRIVFTLALGFPEGAVPEPDRAAALAELDARLTRVTGGITRIEGAGTWTPGSQASDHSGPVERDATAIYLISTMPTEETAALAAIRDAIVAVARRRDLPLDHIHVARSVSEERIFRISDL